MSILDLDKFDNGEMDYLIDKWMQFKEFFSKKIVSVLVIDPDNQFQFSDVLNQYSDRLIFCADLAACTDGDYARIVRTLNYGGYDGVLFDSIDSIPWIEDKAELENLVIESLNRDALSNINDTEGFSTLMVGCKCKKYPKFLEGKSLQAYIIDMKSKKPFFFDKNDN